MFVTDQIKMTIYDIMFKILKKIKDNQNPFLTGDFIFRELNEICNSEYLFRFLLDDLASQKYISIAKDNIADWGVIQITDLGSKYVNEYIPNERTHVNFNNFWEFLEKQIIKHTEDLILSKKGAEIHLKSLTQSMELQKSLAERGKPNCYSLLVKHVDFAQLEVYRYEQELEKRRILSMTSANKIGGNSNNVQQQFSPITAKQALAENIEDEWKNEAKKKGLQSGTLPYIRFINDKKAEVKEIEDEKKRIKIFADFVDQSKHWCNTLELFKRWVKTDSATLSEKDFLLKLREYEVQYSNALYYHTIYGPDNIRVEYGKIKGHILFLQEDILDKIDNGNWQSKDKVSDTNVKSEGINKAPKSILSGTQQRYKGYVESYNYFTQVENLSNDEAEKRTCEKHGISSKTLLRAIRAT